MQRSPRGRPHFIPAHSGPLPSGPSGEGEWSAVCWRFPRRSLPSQYAQNTPRAAAVRSPEGAGKSEGKRPFARQIVSRIQKTSRCSLAGTRIRWHTTALLRSRRSPASKSAVRQFLRDTKQFVDHRHNYLFQPTNPFQCQRPVALCVLCVLCGLTALWFNCSV